MDIYQVVSRGMRKAQIVDRTSCDSERAVRRGKRLTEAGLGQGADDDDDDDDDDDGADREREARLW